MTSSETLKALARIRAMAESGQARERREQARLSLTEMATAIGTGITTLARWELGDQRPRADAALRWLAVLDQLAEETAA